MIFRNQKIDFIRTISWTPHAICRASISKDVNQQNMFLEKGTAEIHRLVYSPGGDIKRPQL